MDHILSIFEESLQQQVNEYQKRLRESRSHLRIIAKIRKEDVMYRVRLQWSDHGDRYKHEENRHSLSVALDDAARSFRLQRSSPRIRSGCTVFALVPQQKGMCIELPKSLWLPVNPEACTCFS